MTVSRPCAGKLCSVFLFPVPHRIWRLCAGAAYLLLQVVVAIRFMDCWEGMECLPLTCCPMFAVPRNLFDDELRAGV